VIEDDDDLPIDEEPSYPAVYGADGSHLSEQTALNMADEFNDRAWERAHPPEQHGDDE
jgi:hypothetical protein